MRSGTRGFLWTTARSPRPAGAATYGMSTVIVRPASSTRRSRAVAAPAGGVPEAGAGFEVRPLEDNVAAALAASGDALEADLPLEALYPIRFCHRRPFRRRDRPRSSEETDRDGEPEATRRPQLHHTTACPSRLRRGNFDRADTEACRRRCSHPRTPGIPPFPYAARRRRRGAWVRMRRTRDFRTASCSRRPGPPSEVCRCLGRKDCCSARSRGGSWRG